MGSGYVARTIGTNVGNRAGEMGYHFAKGLQDKGVSAQVKHFVR
jgi:beta-glucosidase-like glycosyl hydrolase